jgi:hypothetical protein
MTKEDWKEQEYKIWISVENNRFKIIKAWRKI